MAGPPPTVKAGLARRPPRALGRPAMTDTPPPDQPQRPPSPKEAERAERLARQLRANLLRRKAQARSMAGAGTSVGAAPDADGKAADQREG